MVQNKLIAFQRPRNVLEGHALHDFAIMANQRGKEVETSQKQPCFGVFVADRANIS